LVIYDPDSGKPDMLWPGGLNVFQASNGVFATLPGFSDLSAQNLLSADFLGLLVTVSYTPFVSSYVAYPVDTLSANRQIVRLPDAAAINAQISLFRTVTIALPLSVFGVFGQTAPRILIAPEYVGSDPAVVASSGADQQNYYYNIHCFKTRTGTVPIDIVGYVGNTFHDLTGSLPTIQVIQNGINGNLPTGGVIVDTYDGRQ
jgi:hypothetical protein